MGRLNKKNAQNLQEQILVCQQRYISVHTQGLMFNNVGSIICAVHMAEPDNVLPEQQQKTKCKCRKEVPKWRSLRNSITPMKNWGF